VLARLAVGFLLAVALVACGGEPALVLSSWELEAPGGHRETITLPAHVDRALPAASAKYALRATVALPEAMRGKPLTLAIPILYAPATLFANGRPAAPLDVGTDDEYRGNAHPRWRIDAEAASAPTLDLELRLEHTWTQSAWLDAPPRLSASSYGDRAYRTIRAVTDLCADTGLAGMAVTALIYFTMLLLDRGRLAHVYWCIEAVASIPYCAFLLSATPHVFGIYDAPVMSVGLCVSVWAGVQFTHLQFHLPRPPRAWNAGPIVCFVAALFFGGPFASTRVVTPITVVYVSAAMFYQMMFTFRRLRAKDEMRVQALVLFFGWGALAVLGAADFIAWMGFGEIFAGARMACIGIAAIGLLQSVFLSVEHIASQQRTATLNAELATRVDALEAKNREVETLNAELRRQIAARSEHLADALTRLTTGGLPARELAPGDVVDDRYRVVASLGRGGMGVVYEVRRTSDERRLALKLLANAGAMDLARFAREAQIVSRLDHANVVGIVDVAIAASGFIYIVMEHVDGRSLDAYHARYGDPRWALGVLRQIAGGLAAIHAHGVVHRDLKPANVLVAHAADGSSPLVKIADFGISRFAGVAPQVEGESASYRDEGRLPSNAVSGSNPVVGADSVDTVRHGLRRRKSSRPPSPIESGVDVAPAAHLGLRADSSLQGLTQTGMLMGTPRYMAPELVGEARLARPPSDVFSLGVIAYELLARSGPFPEPAALLRLKNERIPRPAPLSFPGVHGHRELASLLERCVAVEAGERPSAARVAEALAGAAAGASRVSA
jgi:serine/threonine-protein kinase